MNKLKDVVEVEDNKGVKFNVHYSVSGNYYAATREQPEEYPDIDIEEVELLVNPSGKAIKINMKKIKESYQGMLYELFIEKAEEQAFG